ncbi:glucoamylase family protein [Granulicella sibirica]|nr:glucoamylase family protein [Granulicella sibirica]
MNRRDALRAIGSVPIALAGSSLLETGCGKHKGAAERSDRALPEHPEQALFPKRPVANQPSNFSPSAVRLLEEVRERAAHYFIERSDPGTGLAFDRAPADGASDAEQYSVASIAATGFGLSALSIAARNGYVPAARCEERMMTSLRFLANRAEHERGFFAHYLDGRSGARKKESEFSSIDTALLVAGAVHAGESLNSQEGTALVKTIVERIDWPWMLNANAVPSGKEAMLSMGWLPGSGFLQARWSSYSECMLMYLLAIASPTHPLPAGIWNAIERNTYDYGGIRFISSFGALFIHQYPHVWLDLRGLKDAYADYYQNSVAAVRAHKTYCLMQHGRFQWVDERVWGFSACDTERREYMAWAAPPIIGEWDGTLSPHAAGGSLTLLPEECIVALVAMREHHPKSFGRYGFVDAFNPGANDSRGWFDNDVVGIDLGLTMLMAENQQTGAVYRSVEGHPGLRRAMDAVQLKRYV